jgi:hypothetical protein
MLLSLTVFLSLSVLTAAIEGHASQTVKVYENQSWGIKIGYPADWDVDESLLRPTSGVPTVYFNPMSEPGPPYVSIEIMRYVKDFSKDADVSYEEAQDWMNTYREYGYIINEHGPAVIDGKEAYSFVYVEPPSSTLPYDMKNIELFIPHDPNILYIFKLTSSVEDYDKYITIVKSMIESAQFQGTSIPPP